MRKLFLAGLLALSALALAGSGVVLETGTRYEFTDCASGGSAAQTVTGGQYLMRVTDSDVFMCLAESGSTCAANGEKFPSGTVILLTISGPSKSISCRSSASTGDLILTKSP